MRGIINARERNANAPVARLPRAGHHGDDRDRPDERRREHGEHDPRARPPGGESIAQVVERVHSFIDILIRDRAGERVLVITHGGTLRAGHRHTCPWPMPIYPRLWDWIFRKHV